MSYPAGEILGAPLWFWVAFATVIFAILTFDLGYLSRRVRVLSLGQSLALTAAYGSLAVTFGIGMWAYFGAEKGSLFFTAYVLEQSLSIDNVFVMSVIFAFFAVPRENQHRVLFWGIVAAMLLRALFVGLGTAMVARFEWLLYIFGAFLIATGIRMIFTADEEPDLSTNVAVQWLTRRLRVTTEIQGDHFFLTRPDKMTGLPKLHATRLFLAFMVINVADIVFAVDSVPAVLSMTQDPFIVYTSNIFAVLGLRSLYFVIDALIAKFRFLKPALSFLLIFIGSIIFYEHLIGEFNNILMMSITFAAIGIAIIASVLLPEKEKMKDEVG
jgi:tellurite resistance protein TerC